MENKENMRKMTLDDVHQVSVDIMQEFHNFCVNNGIHYSLSGGALLGAIRHNGFIPWDDDIDVLMPRPDYDKFIHSYKSNDRFALYCRELPEYRNRMGFPYARLCDMKNTIVDTNNIPWIDDVVGLWIDILPCDGMPSDMNEAKKHLRKNYIQQEIAFWTALKMVSWSYVSRAHTTWEKCKFLIKKTLSYFIKWSYFDNYIKYRKKYDYTTSEYFFGTPFYGEREIQSKKNMESFKLHQYEDREFYIMSGWDAYLTTIFGDYMKLPPVSKRRAHSFNGYYWRD